MSRPPTYRHLAISLGLWLTATAGAVRAECGDWLVHPQDRSMWTPTSLDPRSSVAAAERKTAGDETAGHDAATGRAKRLPGEREVLDLAADEHPRPCRGPYCGAADPPPASATPVVAPRLVDPSVAAFLPASTSAWGESSRWVWAGSRATVLPGVPAPILRPPRSGACLV